MWWLLEYAVYDYVEQIMFKPSLNVDILEITVDINGHFLVATYILIKIICV